MQTKRAVVFADAIEKQVGMLDTVLTRCRGTVSVAESCTGGLLAATLTDYPGCSRWFSGGVVSYTIDAKQRLLGVPARILKQVGPVSDAVALAMASGVRDRFCTDVGVAVTGIAGPSGGTASQPVGTVWIAWVGWGEKGKDVHAAQARLHHFYGDRQTVRWHAVQSALSYFYQGGGNHCAQDK